MSLAKSFLMGWVMWTMSLLSQTVFSQNVPAFPGAEGAGKYVTGGRGGFVYKVTNLNDDGPGSLRDGIQKKGARIIVFDVCGYIDLESPLAINKGDLTIAGQTAPGMGICLRKYGLRVNADNVIIRYIRVRPGDLAKTEMDAMTGKEQKDIIIDHCSVSWATDEVCSFYDNENFTMQYCMISESFNQSVHHKGEHGYGGIWGGMNASFHHNLLASHVSRNPRLNGSRFSKAPDKEKAEIVNNVVYNWRSTCMYAGEEGNYIIRNNYLIPGPATTKTAAKTFFEPYAPYGQFLISGNILEKRPEVSKSNVLGLELGESAMDSVEINARIKVSDYKPEKAKAALKRVIASAGASLHRDSVDLRVINELLGRTASYGDKGIINTQSDAGGYPQWNDVKALTDTDLDGMPDAWEVKVGLDLKNPKDQSEYKLSKIYTNIEVYLNSLVK